MEKFLGAVALFLLGIPLFFLSAMTFAHLWNWFIAVPFALHQINWVLAFGIQMVVSYPFIHTTLALGKIKTKLETDDGSLTNGFTNLLTNYIVVGLTYLMGYLMHLAL